MTSVIASNVASSLQQLDGNLCGIYRCLQIAPADLLSGEGAYRFRRNSQILPV